MVDLTTRAGKGNTLTYTEMDDNFSNLNKGKQETNLPRATFSSNVYTLVYNPTVLAYETGKLYTFIARTANTGNASLTIDGLSTIDIRLLTGSHCPANTIVPGQAVKVHYNGTYFIILNPFIAHSTEIFDRHGVGAAENFSGPFTNIAMSSANNSASAITVTGLSESTWGEYGPTAGSATAWTPMDDLPATGVGAVYITLTTSITPSVKEPVISFYAKPGHSSDSVDASTLKWQNHWTDTNTDNRDCVMSMWIPVDPADNSFYLAWAATGDSARVMTVIYKGCMFAV